MPRPGPPLLQAVRTGTGHIGIGVPGRTRDEVVAGAPAPCPALQPFTTSGTRAAGGVLRLRVVRTMPSITVMPTPGRLP